MKWATSILALSLTSCSTAPKFTSDPAARLAYYQREYPDTPLEVLVRLRIGEVWEGMNMSQAECALGPPHYTDGFFRNWICWTYFEPRLFLCFDDGALALISTTETFYFDGKLLIRQCQSSN